VFFERPKQSLKFSNFFNGLSKNSRTSFHYNQQNILKSCCMAISVSRQDSCGLSRCPCGQQRQTFKNPWTHQQVVHNHNPGMWVARGRQATCFPKICGISSHFMLWEAVSEKNTVALLKPKGFATPIFWPPKHFGLNPGFQKWEVKKITC